MKRKCSHTPQMVVMSLHTCFLSFALIYVIVNYWEMKNNKSYTSYIKLIVSCLLTMWVHTMWQNRIVHKCTIIEMEFWSEIKQSACNKHTLQELQQFMSKNDNISNFLFIRVIEWIIWGIFLFSILILCFLFWNKVSIGVSVNQ